MHLLVIEDDRGSRELLTALLERDGHTVVAEVDGASGYARALAERFDLILCDIELPRMDGFAVCRALRGEGIRIPVLALTARSAAIDRLAGEQAGFTGYLAKPIRMGALRDGLRVSAPQMVTSSPPIASSASSGSGVVASLLGRAGPDESGAAPPWACSLSAPPAPAAAVALGPAAATSALVAPPRRGVLAGLVVIAMGVPFLLQPLGVPNAPSYLFLAMGIAFLISYLRGRQYVYLIPMVTFTSFGLALLLPTWIALRPEAEAPAFVGFVALGLFAAFVLAPERRWPLVPAAILGVAAGSQFLTGASPVPQALQPYFVPLILVGVGCYLLVERRS